MRHLHSHLSFLIGFTLAYSPNAASEWKIGPLLALVLLSQCKRRFIRKLCT